MASERTRLGAFVPALLLVAFVAGCDDPVARAQAQRREELKGRLKQSLDGLEQQLSAPKPDTYPAILKDVAKARAMALEVEDTTAAAKADDIATRARQANDKLLQQAFAILDSKAKDALDKSDPDQATQACSATLDALLHAPGPVCAKFGKELDALRQQLAQRAEAAKRAKDVLATAKQLKDESKNLEARAVCKSFEVVDSLRQSPFKGVVMALMNDIPEKSDEEQFFTVFDGSDPQQINYFTREHMWTWKLEDNVLHGDNSEYDDTESTIWLGDDTPPGWADYVLEVRFRADNVGLNIILRATKDENDKLATGDTVSIRAGDVPPGTWALARVVVKGQKATYSVNGGESKSLDLSAPKGLLGLSLPGAADVKVQSVKIHLLDKDAKPPKLKVQEEQPKNDDEPAAGGKKKRHKKKKAGADAAKPDGDKAGGEAAKPDGDKPAPSDEKKDDEKKDGDGS